MIFGIPILVFALSAQMSNCSIIYNFLYSKYCFSCRCMYFMFFLRAELGQFSISFILIFLRLQLDSFPPSFRVTGLKPSCCLPFLPFQLSIEPFTWFYPKGVLYSLPISGPRYLRSMNWYLCGATIFIFIKEWSMASLLIFILICITQPYS